jgi:Family of unknown function (DUF6454)
MKPAALLSIALSLSGCQLLTPDLIDHLLDRGPSGPPENRDDATTTLFRKLNRLSTWQLVSSVPMQGWQTFHTEGLVKIGDLFYVSAVEVTMDRQRFGTTDALTDFSTDRTPGAGRGWLFKFDGAGNLLGKVEMTEGIVYHPGGIDHDGRWIWVPVSEYRPNSFTNFYRVDPVSMQAEIAFTAKDHIGGIVHDKRTGNFHGVSWGSRRLYTWQVGKRGDKIEVRRESWVPNPEHYIDYQDCHLAGSSFMLCGGLTGFSTPLGSLDIGGLELVDLRTNQPVHQIPVTTYLDEGKGPNPGLAATHNAFWAEPLPTGSMRFYFMTETDNQADLVTYDVTPWRKPTP